MCSIKRVKSYIMQNGGGGGEDWGGGDFKSALYGITLILYSNAFYSGFIQVLFRFCSGFIQFCCCCCCCFQVLFR